ncbi:hypothetical protein F5148DRAFT_1285455 [Russula earlei]|uniref:Uncharacterized protein n=1 Tax=Russula earlei TaxID=71964 RepID=A0ACC0U6Q2_9AGAM|nr:hypothetical protein F5148DRAFT_1285455 [Russula earlei]
MELAEKYKGEGWSTTHGFFAIMGGFMETGPSEIAKAEIQDKSKGDVVSKMLVIANTSRFVVQCIARGVQGLPVTELELVTVAFATLNFVMYLLWWDKPLNVHRGVRVYKQRQTDHPVDDGDIEATSSAGLRDALSELQATQVSLCLCSPIGWYQRV